jgi:heme/copper-type cytochrome/quinol oxidase subunit 4
MRRFSIGFALAVGAGIIAWWIVVFATGQVPEMAGAPCSSRSM